jgi:hypothetical protein
VLPADDDVGLLRAFVALVAVERDGFLVDLDLAAVEADRDEGFDQGLAVLEAGRAFNIMGHWVISNCSGDIETARRRRGSMAPPVPTVMMISPALPAASAGR